MNYFNEVVCKAIELLVTCKLVISGLNFRCHFRYDQEGNVLLRSAVIHLKRDGRHSIFQVSFPGFVFVLLLVTGISLVTRFGKMYLVTLSTQLNGDLHAFSSLGRRL